MKRAISYLISATLLFISSLGVAQDSDPPQFRLELNEVLRSLRRSHPSVEEARQLVLARQGDLLSSEGAYDTKLKLGAKAQPVGKYTKGQIQALVTQVTPWWGASFFAGWRQGFGTFPIYDGDLETLSGGEFSAGFEVPLWRGGPIDDMRARMQQAEFDVLSAKEQQQLVSLVLENAAARAYWNWVEAGQQLGISEQLLQVATGRAAGLTRRIDKGDAPSIIGVDNDRIVFDRQTKVILARQKLAQAAVKLSLYLRDAKGDPRRPADATLPISFPLARQPGPARVAQDIRNGRSQRPDLLMLSIAEDRQRVEAAFRANEVAPSINLRGWLAQDIGAGKDELRPLDLGVGLNVEIPVLLRKERGKLRSAQAKLAAARQKTRLARDKVEAEIRVAFAAVQGAFETVALARKQRTAAERLADAERRKFELGETDLLTVNLRELSAADAAAREIAAQANYQRALADYRTAAGQSPR